MHVLIAPDKFKGTLTAPAAALAIAEGVRAAQPSSVISLCPVADGGEGTLPALIDGIGGSKVYFSTVDPWGKPFRTVAASLDDGTVCIGSSTAGFGDPLRADSFGVGSVIGQLLSHEPAARIRIAIGGTASTDGGTGMARALGWRFLDAGGNELPPGGAELISLHTVVPPRDARPLEVTGLCDVDAPLTGEAGSARGFAPQKGATPEQVELLERGLERLVEVVRDDLGVDLDVPGAGAGGGIGAAIVAFCGGNLVAGFDVVARSLRLRARIQGVDLVMTGEGRFDAQSLQGKAAAGVARMSHEEGVPCLGLVGGLEVPMPVALKAGFSDVSIVSGDPDSAPAARLTEAAQMLMSRQPV